MRTVCRILLLAASLAALSRSNVEVEIQPHGETRVGQPEENGVIEADTLSAHAMRVMHRKVDTNGDGLASMNEFLHFASSMRKAIAARDTPTLLAELDSDKDGELSSEEYIKDIKKWSDHHEPGLDQDKALEFELAKFKAADSDWDGRLCREELPALFYPETDEGVLRLVVYEAMKQKDRNGDRRLSPEEFAGAEPGEDEEASAELGVTEQEKADFEELDTDADGSLDFEEMAVWESGRFHTIAALKSLFAAADADEDNDLTADELENSRETIAGTEAQYHLMDWAEHHEL